MSDVDPSTGPGHRLATDLAGMHLPSPVLTAAGCGGRELAPFTDLAALGAVVSRTVTLDAQAGSPPPRVAETPSGVLHATGAQNPGLQGFLATELPWYGQQGVRAIVSISAGTLAEYGELARRIATASGVSAVEVHLAVPDAHQTGKVLQVVRRDLPRGTTVLAKLAPGGDVVEQARAAVDNGADADDRDVRQRGVGGIRSGFDALAMLLAGATAVQLGSVLLRDPSAATRIRHELVAELDRRDLKSAADAVGLAHQQPEGSSR